MYHSTRRARNVADLDAAADAYRDGFRIPEDMRPDEWKDAWEREADQPDPKQMAKNAEAVSKGLIGWRK